MASRGRPRLYPDEQTKWRELKRRQRHPSTRYLPASHDPGEYTFSLEALRSAGRTFRCIVADPPWPYANQGTRGSTHHHYPPMSIEEICALPIAALAADQAHLHLWTTNAFLFDCPQIFAAWGFTFKSSFVWVKPSIGTGNYWRNAHELLLLGVRGGVTAQQKNLISWNQAKRGGHSEKSAWIRDRIEQLSPGPYLELFGRSTVPGWTVWGNECLPSTGRLWHERF
jgi:N6-adenosine-specific RNA methylase IME4